MGFKKFLIKNDKRFYELEIIIYKENNEISLTNYELRK